MKTRYMWNSDFEALMGTLRTFLDENPAIEIVNLDWKYQQLAEQRNGRWYLLMVYKPQA